MWIDSVNDNKVIMNAISTSKAYRFNSPILNNKFLKIGSYSVVNVKNSNLTHPTIGI